MTGTCKQERSVGSQLVTLAKNILIASEPTSYWQSSSPLPYGSKVAAERRFAYRTAAAERDAFETAIERLVLDTAERLAVERLVLDTAERLAVERLVLDTEDVDSEKQQPLPFHVQTPCL